MEKFLLDLEKYEEIIEEAKNIRRKRQSAWIKDLSKDIMDVICMHNLKSLSASFYSSEYTKASELIEALNNLPALMYLDVRFLFIADDISKTVDFKKIRINLKELRYFVDVLHSFDCSTLRTLELMSYEAYNYRVIMDFLSQQKDLKDYNFL